MPAWLAQQEDENGKVGPVARCLAIPPAEPACTGDGGHSRPLHRYTLLSRSV